MSSTLVAVALSTLVAAQGAQTRSRDTKASQRNACWPGEAEIQNPHIGSRRTPLLPPELADEKVQRSVMSLKLCVSETGEVARVLLLRSSGNAKVDTYYTTELSKWTFKPAEREKRSIRSVVPVTVTLYVK
jgi:TonB family protein